MFLIVLLLIIGGCITFCACFLPIFILDSFSEYRKSVRTLIMLLDKKGYYPQQILNILSFYDSEFFEPKSSEPIEILIPLT